MGEPANNVNEIDAATACRCVRCPHRDRRRDRPEKAVHSLSVGRLQAKGQTSIEVAVGLDGRRPVIGSMRHKVTSARPRMLSMSMPPSKSWTSEAPNRKVREQPKPQTDLRGGKCIATFEAPSDLRGVNALQLLRPRRPETGVRVSTPASLPRCGGANALQLLRPCNFGVASRATKAPSFEGDVPRPCLSQTELAWDFHLVFL